MMILSVVITLTAAKVDPTDQVGSTQRDDARTVLQMDFKSQIIPLFQFAAFYDRDLEINSSTPMTLAGRVHTNANLYVQPTPLTSIDPDITSAIGEYFGKADLRLEMTPNSPIPFKFTAIQSGTNARGGTCTTTVTSGQDPAQNYIKPNREGSNFKCTQLNLGQITSLQQPVLVLTRGNAEEEARFCARPTDGS